MTRRTDPWVVIGPTGGVRQPMWRRLRAELPLLRLWTARELRSRYRQSWLRFGWSLLQPTVTLLTYGWIFSILLNVEGDGIPYLTFAWAGLVPFALVQQALGQGVGSIQHAGSMISKVYFPREILPLSVVGAGLFDLGVTTGILIIITIFQMGVPPATIFLLPLVYLTLVAWVAGVTVLAAALTSFRRDLNLAMPLLLRALFILTPIMYPVGLLNDAVGAWVWLNPLTVIVESVRDVALRGDLPNMMLLGPCFLAGLCIFFFSIVLVQRYEHRMADWV